MENSDLTLWQINISHYAEKVRWALDYKGIDHVRRSPQPAMHMMLALWLSRGAETTLPIMQLEGVTVTDSTAIIAALEQRYPNPPLYPTDPEHRRRALELEDFFDEELGPYVRLYLWHELLSEPEMLNNLASLTFPERLRNCKRITGAWTRAFVILRYGVSREGAANLARRKILAATDRLDAALEANGGEYLIGDSFSVADLTAASLFNPMVGSEQGPLPPGVLQVPESYATFCGELGERPGFLWVHETFRRHRNRAEPRIKTAAIA
jgi:glutathione S-transferase